MLWAQVVGVVLATLSAVGQLLTIPSYRLCSIVLLAFGLFIIWPLCTSYRTRHAWPGRPARYTCTDPRRTAQ
jgi:hypothetical protein